MQIKDIISKKLRICTKFVIPTKLLAMPNAHGSVAAASVLEEKPASFVVVARTTEPLARGTETQTVFFLAPFFFFPVPLFHRGGSRVVVVVEAAAGRRLGEVDLDAVLLPLVHAAALVVLITTATRPVMMARRQDEEGQEDPSCDRADEAGRDRHAGDGEEDHDGRGGDEEEGGDHDEEHA